MTVYSLSDIARGRMVPVNAGVALPLGSRVRFVGDMANAGAVFVVVDEIPNEHGQRAIALTDPRRDRTISRHQVESEGYRYTLQEGREPMPNVCRLIAEHHEARRAEAIRREQESQKADALEIIGRNVLNQSRPVSAKAAIFAVLVEDASDIQTDYFATREKRAVLLAWSMHTRDLFPELRKAAARFPDTAPLAAAPKSAEHREKYSMGAGFYLQEGGRYSSGWKVFKTTRPESYTQDLALEGSDLSR